MLVLSRHAHEAVWIGDNIRIVVADIRHGKVRLAIEAPRDVPILREELLPDGHPGAQPKGRDRGPSGKPGT